MAGYNQNHIFFKADPPHGEAKRSIYKQYMDDFIKKELDNENTLVIVDGFAGKGYYGEVDHDIDIEKCGSPIIALRLCMDEILRRQNIRLPVPGLPGTLKSKTFEADQLRDNPPQIHLIFNELEGENFKCLARYVTACLKRRYITCITRYYKGQWHDRARIYVQCVNYLIRIDIFKQKFENLKAKIDRMNDRIPANATWFSIMDAFSGAHIPLEEVVKYLGPRKQAFINVMTNHMNRFTKNQTAVIARLFGIPMADRAERVQALKDPYNGEDMGSGTRRIAARYMDKLKERTNTTLALQFEMRTERNSPLYNLVFLAHDQEDARLMKKAMWDNSQSNDRYCLQFSDKFADPEMRGHRPIRRAEPDPTEHLVASFPGNNQAVPVHEAEWAVLKSSMHGTLTIAHLQDMLNNEKIRRVLNPNRQDAPLIADKIGDIRNWKIVFRGREIDNIEQGMADLHL